MAIQVRAGVLAHFFEVIREHSLDPAPLLRETGLRRDMLSDPDGRIPLAGVVTLLEQSAERAGCPSLALLMTERRQPADFGPVGLLLQHQASLRASVEMLQRYEHLLNDSLAMHLTEQEGVAVLRAELTSGRLGGARQATELSMGVLFRLCRAVLGPTWRPLEVRFVHAEPPETRVHHRLFRCPLVFGAEFNGFVIDGADLDRQNPDADDQMARYARRYLDSMPASRGGGVEQQVRNALYILLPSGRGGLDAVAASLGFNARTLQRRLDLADLTFGGLLDDVRAELAERYLRAGAYPMGEIADLLGYASASAFTRWFGARFGTSPSAFRRSGLAS